MNLFKNTFFFNGENGPFTLKKGNKQKRCYLQQQEGIISRQAHKEKISCAKKYLTQRTTTFIFLLVRDS
jgi:hypothetical protein